MFGQYYDRSEKKYRRSTLVDLACVASMTLRAMCNDIDRAAVAKRHMFHNAERLGKSGR
jgi:hypothetical protein